MTAAQYNLTKVFQMKLKTTKHNKCHLRGKKPDEPFGQPSVSGRRKLNLQE